MRPSGFEPETADLESEAGESLEFVRVCDLPLHRVLIQGFGRCPPSAAQIVGWIVGDS